MAWTAPLTATANTSLSAADFNIHVRDNLNETEVAKATGLHRYFVATGTNAIAQRGFASYAVEKSATTTSTSYTDLTGSAGASSTLTTGTSAVVWMASILQNSGTGMSAASIDVSGATTVAASDDWMIASEGLNTGGNGQRVMQAHRFTALTAGSHTFKMVYRVSAGTGTFSYREIMVMPF